MIDNFELIESLLNFDNSDEFYFLQVIQRKKDFEEGQKRIGRNNNNRLIKAYYIYNLQQLREYKEEIVCLCHLFNARAGINLNRRHTKDVTLKCLEMIAIALRKNEFDCISKIYNSACGKESSTDKTWIVDIDVDEKNKHEGVVDYIENYCQPFNGSKIITKIPSRNGYHLITKRFDREKFASSYPFIEIHTNNPTNLYIC